MSEVNNRYKRDLEVHLQTIRNSKEILEENKKLIFDFHSFSVADGLSVATLRQQISDMCVWSKMIKKPFDTVTKDDVIKLVEELENRTLSERYRFNLKFVLKKFYKWLRQTEDYPPEVKWIKNRPKNNGRLPEELLTEEEVERLASAADNLRDKALVLILYESGCRLGELLSLKIKNIQFDDYGCVLIVNGKTGSRRLRVIKSAKALTSWLDIHPLKNDPEAYVWISIGNKNRNQLITHETVDMLLRKLKDRSGVNKRVNPHSFRHARATHLAKQLPEAIMKEFFGWTPDSKMASIYYHLSGRDVDEALLKLHGLKPKENEDLKKISARTCQKCGESNSALTQFCKRCNSPLDLKIALQLDETRNNYDRAMLELLWLVTDRLTKHNPKLKQEIRKDFRKWVGENKLEHLFS
jgi:site-specific recombinase XerD